LTNQLPYNYVFFRDRFGCVRTVFVGDRQHRIGVAADVQPEARGMDGERHCVGEAAAPVH